MSMSVVRRLFLFSISLLIIAASVTIIQSQVSFAKDTANKDDFEYIEEFSNVISLLEAYYVDNVSEDTLLQGAINGLFLSLDPHSGYMNASSYKEFKESSSGRYFGVGLVISRSESAIVVVSPIKGSPAFKAGLKAGDIIIKIDNTLTGSLSTTDAAKMIRGPIKTKVRITVVRDGEKDPLVFTLVRDEIVQEIVESKKYGVNVGYISLSTFNDQQSYNKLARAFTNMDKQGVEGFVLDLRGNGGGFLDEAIKIASIFLPENSLVVYTEGRSGQRSNYTTRRVSYTTGKPVVILVDEGSASASEIVAGALQDHNRALVIGGVTFGKASVQTLFPLDTGSAVKLTIARYYTPNGRSIQGVGIAPDVPVAKGLIQYEKPAFILRESDLSNTLQSNSTALDSRTTMDEKVDSDLQLETAINVLKGMIISEKRRQGK